MLKAIIVDDEYPAREELKCMLEELKGIQVIGEFEDGSETVEFLKWSQHQTDVIFLDVQMREKDGITTAWEILQLPHPPHIIFVTGYGEYAVKAFELNAVDYILKPYDEQRLEQTIKKLQSLHVSSNLANTRVCDFFNKNEASGHRRFCVWANERMLILHPADIFFVKADEKGKCLICSAKGNFITKLALKEIEEKLASQSFFRTHKSYLVNLDKVCEVIPWFNNTYMLRLEGYNDEQVPVARHYLKEFNKAFEKI
ncbi:Hypothetical protein LUCI_4939 [Lucifera butyrica]|uniref:Uncharacterized protein n=1 Tax=Lucifera butyrica TaxID=1351585 RepID=A0A498RDT8_9FIRM|nr:LytTR family DNA-binding domain-containing protein [Lucifera butyrica]VBB09641.1 Hypothetical protein LUCI_4939 [Lucifera butyrica]